MAILNRRGAYEDMEPTSALPGEFLICLSGDPHAKDGRSVYICFKTGELKRLSTYEDIVDNMDESLGDVKGLFTKDIEDLIDDIKDKLESGYFNGSSATITIGTVTTGEPGTEVKVTNTGTPGAAVLNFTIPRGLTGEVENLDTAIIDFTQASSRENIDNTDTLKVILGKIQKIFSDLKEVSFSGKYSDISEAPEIQSGVTGTIPVFQNQSADLEVTFPKEFTKAPNVVVGLLVETKNVDYGSCSLYVVESTVTKTGFTLRAVNDSDGGLSPKAYWIATA